MALDQSAALVELSEALQSADAGELLRTLLTTIVQALVEAEATAHVGADRDERSEARTTQRNGHRAKMVTTTAGDLTVKIPKVRTGSFFLALLEARRRIDAALHAVVMQAYVEGVSTRRVDDLVQALRRHRHQPQRGVADLPVSTPMSRPGVPAPLVSRHSLTCQRGTCRRSGGCGLRTPSCGWSAMSRNAAPNTHRSGNRLLASL